MSEASTKIGGRAWQQDRRRAKNTRAMRQMDVDNSRRESSGCVLTLDGEEECE